MDKNNTEVIKCVYDDKGNLIAFFRNDIKNRTLRLYLCQEAGLDDVDDLFNLKPGFEFKPLEKNEKETKTGTL